jgi:PAS domain S-box-containing protein
MTQPLPIDFEQVFMHAPIGMCVSHNRMIQQGNQAMAAMFGYEVDALRQTSFQEIYPTADEFERTGLRLVPILNEKGFYSDERIMKRSNDEMFWCHVTGHALNRDNPHAAGIWTFEDVSAKRPIAPGLTPREREIAALLVEGKTSKLIARQVELSPRTVEMHRARLMRKFAASTSSELVHKLLSITLILPLRTAGRRSAGPGNPAWCAGRRHVLARGIDPIHAQLQRLVLRQQLHQLAAGHQGRHRIGRHVADTHPGQHRLQQHRDFVGADAAAHGHRLAGRPSSWHRTATGCAPHRSGSGNCAGPAPPPCAACRGAPGSPARRR